MNVLYNEKTRERGEALKLLEQATSCLEEILGPSRDRVKVEWDRTEDEKRRTRYTLRLSDWTGAVSANFAPDELQSPSEMRYRLLRLWGDLLQIRSEKLLDDLTGASQDPGE